MPLPNNLPLFAREYFQARPEFLDALEQMEKRRGIRLLNNAWSEPNQINFYARVAEMRFGLFFDQYVKDLWYMSAGQQKTGLDHKRANQQYIAEVLRVNADEQEMHSYFEENRMIHQFQKENPGLPIFAVLKHRIYFSAGVIEDGIFSDYPAEQEHWGY